MAKFSNFAPIIHLAKRLAIKHNCDYIRHVVFYRHGDYIGGGHGKDRWQVVEVLRQFYAEKFGGKTGQRFLISWGDLRAIYGFRKLFSSRFYQLAEIAFEKRLCLWDLGEIENGHLIAVVKTATINRWRRIPKKLIEGYRLALDDDGDNAEDDNKST